jgi:uncharacterized membrane protein YidH (DUF202 family)
MNYVIIAITILTIISVLLLIYHTVQFHRKRKDMLVRSFTIEKHNSLMISLIPLTISLMIVTMILDKLFN